MIPGRAIEYLLTIVKPGGLRLVTQEGTQILIPIFPPNTTLSFSAGPLGTDYGQIVFGARFGDDMVPNAFTGFIQIWGTRYLSGTFTPTVLTTEIHGFIWVTHAQPAFIHLTNVSGLNQLLEILYVNLRITNEDDYNTVIKELKHMATSETAEQLAREANQLLGILTGRVPAPPPEEGS